MNREGTTLPPEHFLQIIRRQQRGRLKLYLGFAAGVGKTYRMLQEARALKQQGVDVAVAVVETHGRAETAALLEGLEQLPKKRTEYRSVVLEEMDLDAVLTRRPTIVLVDELAHTNAPGSRHAKRYQDVEEILRAGIHVIGTVNIQHIESLYDIVEQSTGVKVKERVPDYILAMADQIVNVDLSAEDLRDRLNAGKIYPKERVASALTSFFTMENLTRLRELALQETVHLLDRKQRQEKADKDPSGPDRVAVCVRSRSPDASALLRKGRRIAERLGAPWYVVYVKSPSEAAQQIDAATQRRIANTLTLAQQLGGLPLEFISDDVAGTLASFVREYQIRMLVLGRPNAPWYARFLGGSFIDRLLRTLRGADVLVADCSSI
jgi:two-component system sensor histidine kinase KdpD